jgi:small subunit ribosomal protein S14
LKKKTEAKKNAKAWAKNICCSVCRTNRGMINKYGLKICRRCFREVAPSIGFKKLS